MQYLSEVGLRRLNWKLREIGRIERIVEEGGLTVDGGAYELESR